MGLQVNYSLFLSDFNELSRQFLENYSNIKFNENSSSGSWSIRKKEWADMTHLIVPLRNFTNVPTKRVRSMRTCQAHFGHSKAKHRHSWRYKSSGMWRYVFRWAVPDVSEEHNAFNLRVQSNTSS